MQIWGSRKIRTVNNINISIFCVFCAECSSFLVSPLRFLGLDFSSLTCNFSFLRSCSSLFLPVHPESSFGVFFVFARLWGHALSQVVPISALAMKSHRRDLWPAAKPFPNTSQIINMSIREHITVELCVRVLHACTTLHFSACTFSALLPIIQFKTLHVHLPKNWQQTEIANCTYQHTALQTSPSLPNVNFCPFFLSATPPSLRAGSRLFGSM